MNRLKDKFALVTGGAMGLGRAMALLLANVGAKVVVTVCATPTAQAR